MIYSLVVLRPWQTRTHCCGHIFAHDVSWAAQTGKHLLRTQMFLNKIRNILCPGHKICVRNRCCVRGQTKKHLCRQQCVPNNVSSFARAFSLPGLWSTSNARRFGTFYLFLSHGPMCDVQDIREVKCLLFSTLRV